MAKSLLTRSRTHLPTRSSAASHSGNNSHSARAESEDCRLRKDHFEVFAKLARQNVRSALKTLRGTLSPNRSPVAEANSSLFLLLLVYYIRCRARSERFKNPACHTCSRRLFFYTTPRARVQGAVDEVGAPQPAILSKIRQAEVSRIPRATAIPCCCEPRNLKRLRFVPVQCQATPITVIHPFTPMLPTPNQACTQLYKR